MYAFWVLVDPLPTMSTKATIPLLQTYVVSYNEATIS